MHRTDGADNVNNRFTDNIPGTVVGASWLNAVQEEIVGVIEGAGMSLNSSSADSADQLLAAINSLIDEAVAARTLADHPVDSVYAQFPAVASSTESVAFPVADRPATKYGGTWTEIFSTDDAFFKVGTTDHQTRIDGKSAGQIEDHTHYSGVTTSQNTASGNTYAQGTSVLTSGSAKDTGVPITGNHGTKTEPENRRMKVWKRTA